ncbi:glycosyltransferase family 4 protein [Synechococcus sp. MW101C3]|uniref:glycosyltransferase family 4 protein n=1 Tax=Synechococcus sp. MW101C3 TaxID=210768 RepID=UPI0011819AA3|nr:glycosyltransferase family 4 protein [Synechococcus sp. MW101C3]
MELNQVSADYSLTDIVIPAFSESGYIDPKRYSAVSSYCEQARSFYCKLKSFDADILIGHTLLHFHLYGLGLYLAFKQSKHVVISLMFSPYEGLRSEASEQHDYCFTSIALRSLNDAALSNGHRIIVGVTSEYHWELLAEFRQNYPFLSFTRSPWLVGLHNAGADLRASLKSHGNGKEFSRSKVLLYLGDAKPDKGIETVREFLKWITQLPADDLAEAASRIQIEVHITYCDDWLQSCVDEIRLLCDKLPRLALFSDRHYSSEEYFEVLATANKIVWLYDPDNYKFRTSGIFYDAVSLHCLRDNTKELPEFVVSQGSWMEREFKLLGFEPRAIDLSTTNWMNHLWQFMNQVRTKSELSTQPNKDLLSVFTGQSWNDWIVAALSLDQEKLLSQLTQADCESRPLVVISTDYPHFTRLSGPTGFVQYLEGALHFKTCLGKSQEYDWIRTLTGLKSATDDALRLETELIGILKYKSADIICVDGEHAGSLLGLALRDHQVHPDTRIFTWFHQPSSILSTDIIDQSAFPAAQINPICISPCQVSFFQDELNVGSDRVSVIPHGVHAELIAIGQQSALSRTERLTPNGFGDSFKLLTVGNWLRDRALIFKAAEACPAYEFVWVSTGMALQSHEHAQAQSLGNLKIITSGLSNRELHHEYMTSDFLFQPLISATANNAIIEAMAFGLPIITKSLESTTYYTANQALYYSSPDEAVELLVKLPDYTIAERHSISQALQNQVGAIGWEHISNAFLRILNS